MDDGHSSNDGMQICLFMQLQTQVQAIKSLIILI